ncbi:MAG: rod shape-determining protein RodA [Ignavibacteriales bacterium]|nr:rod shape-determining protein RodA [Ignavibacteriales bacterium]
MFAYFKEYFDFKVFFVTLGLVAVGLLSVYSATYDAGAGLIFQRQLMWAGIGFVGMLAAAILPLKTIHRMAFPAYVVSLLVLLALLVIGKTVSGSRSWLGVAGLGGQPSEFAKVAAVLAFAAFLSRSTTLISDPKHLFAAITLIVIPMGLVLVQPDLGTSVVFLAVILPVLYWVGADHFSLAAILSPLLVAAGALFGTSFFVASVIVSAVLLYVSRKNRFIAAMAFAVTLAVGLSVQFVFERMPSYQQKRIMTFLNPEADPLGSGYNVLQAKVAIGSGGMFGKGYLKGTQTQLNFIPEQWTDFIFCVPGEEFGFLGASIVLVLFGALLLRGLTVGSASKNKFASIAAVGITSVFATHLLINVGMSMGLMPVIGIPLPFLSYGGSALLANMVMSGLLMNFWANRKEY